MQLTSLERGRPLGRARGVLLSAAAALLLLGCADRSAPTANGAPIATQSPAQSSAEREAFAAQVLAARDQAHARASARAGNRPPVVWPAPEATPTGGRRIDLRKVPDHVQTLERQPDGSWKRFCRAGGSASASGSGL